MKIKLQNKDLLTLINTIKNMHLSKMKINRNRAKFLKRLLEKDQEYFEDSKSVRDKHLVLENDTPKKDENGNLIYKDESNEAIYVKEMEELTLEEIVIEGGEYSTRFQEFFEYLLNAEDIHMSGNEAIIIDSILDQYEEQKGGVK